MSRRILPAVVELTTTAVIHLTTKSERVGLEKMADIFLRRIRDDMGSGGGGGNG